jgi:XisH protein
MVKQWWRAIALAKSISSALSRRVHEVQRNAVFCKKSWFAIGQDIIEGVPLSQFTPIYMSAKDVYHDVVKTALEQDGWTITHDPLILKFTSNRRLRIDLGAEQLIAAEKESTRIAIEIKSFIAPSDITEFHLALGQFLNYRVALKVKAPERILYLAVPLEIYNDFFSEELTQLSVQEYNVKILVFDPEKEVITQWID